ncbi:MAG: competence/damage-inducible protein A [Bacteroidales bacterium]|nr:competence/damage-inducible protein A [Bacteroidales bacterium]MBN2820219.1 competence/damage-inducible protein A [Bacteroidales bacterium]
MQAIIITIGDEILIGQVVDTNSAFIGSELNKIGIQVKQIISISDNAYAIQTAIAESLGKADLVILTGGLGPTNDDITKHTIAEFFGVKLVRNQKVLEHIQKLLKYRGVNFTNLNMNQADVPENCQILNNLNGTAPGMLFKTSNNKVLVSLPGVPFEMKPLITDELIPWLMKSHKLPLRKHKTFLTTGVPESSMANRLVEFEKDLPESMSLAYLPSPGILRLRLSISGESEPELAKIFEYHARKLETYLKKDLFGYDSQTLEELTGEMLRRNKYTLSTAESCTGGNIAHLLTSVSGASDYFMGSVVAYSNKIKENILGVSKKDLEEFGAVSKQVVIQMANGIREKFNTDFALATSGIAGPTGGSDDKPVGTVWIALASHLKTIAIKFQFGEHRQRTITRSSYAALNMLRLQINKIVEKTVEKV